MQAGSEPIVNTPSVRKSSPTSVSHPSSAVRSRTRCSNHTSRSPWVNPARSALCAVGPLGVEAQASTINGSRKKRGVAVMCRAYFRGNLKRTRRDCGTINALSHASLIHESLTHESLIHESLIHESLINESPPRRWGPRGEGRGLRVVGPVVVDVKERTINRSAVSSRCPETRLRSRDLGIGLCELLARPTNARRIHPLAHLLEHKVSRYSGSLCGRAVSLSTLSGVSESSADTRSNGGT